MRTRSFLAISLGSSMAVAFATDVPHPQSTSVVTAGCPELTAQITLNDYDGTHVLLLCVAPQGLSISGGTVKLQVYDNQADGLFHNGFEIMP